MSDCAGCHIYLSKPYISCAECSSVCLCLRCFAGGFESTVHRNDHSYEVIKDDFPLFNSSWTAVEELQLLDAIAECGFSNWDEVAEHMRYRSAEECKLHYQQFYLEQPHPRLPEMPLADSDYFVRPLPFKVSNCPPRPSDDSSQQMEMSGYCPARSDFNVEHNNFAELDLRDIVFSATDSHLDTALQMSMLRIYRNILKERQRRKFFIRQFGLIDTARHLGNFRRHEQILGAKSVECLRRLSCLFLRRPSYFDFCLEALTLESTLRQRISELQHFRHVGLRWLKAAKVYSKMVTNQQANDFHLMKDVLRYIQESYQCQPWIQQKMVFDKLSKSIDVNCPAPVRRTAPPLDIVGLPGYDRLTDSEKQLCARVRLVPESYLEFKRLLIAEHDKQGHLRLAQARTLIKIDVNKTRKIYDFLINAGLITNG